MDIAVHEKLAGGKIKEIYQASGGAWGGTAVEEGYRQLLIRIFGGPTIRKFQTEYIYDFMDMMREFEVAKRSLKPDGWTSFNTRIPASLNKCCSQENGETIEDILAATNFPLKGQIKLIGDKLSIKSDIMKNIIKYVIEQIVDHIKRIISDSNVENCSLILLVGGFSESPFVQNAIKEQFQTEGRRIIVPHEAGLSVVKGAAIAGHALNIVTDRVVRYHYGIGMNVPFHSEKHPEKFKYIEKDKSVWAFGKFKTFMFKNTSVKEGTVVKVPGHKACFHDNFYTRVYASDRDVQFIDEKWCAKLCDIHIYNDDLKPYIGKRLDFQNKFIFGRTEIGIEVEVEQTKTKFTASVEA